MVEFFPLAADWSDEMDLPGIPETQVDNERPQANRVSPQACGTCGAAATPDGNPASPPAYVYALGRIEPRFPSISIEKEFAQAAGRDSTTGLTDRQALRAVLLKPENRYLLRALCWVMTIQGLDTYVVRPRDSADFALLLDSLRPNPSPLDLDVLIGLRGPLAPADWCNGLTAPIVFYDQVYSFDRGTLVGSIPRPDHIAAEQFGPTAEELFDRMMQIADNAGATDEHRALNYLAVRYPAIYAAAAEAHGRNDSLSGVEVRASRLSFTRKIVDVIFSFTNRNTDVTEKVFVRVDVSEEFPFLVTKLSVYYDR